MITSIELSIKLSKHHYEEKKPSLKDLVRSLSPHEQKSIQSVLSTHNYNDWFFDEDNQSLTYKTNNIPSGIDYKKAIDSFLEVRADVTCLLSIHSTDNDGNKETSYYFTTENIEPKIIKNQHDLMFELSCLSKQFVSSNSTWSDI